MSHSLVNVFKGADHVFNIGSRSDAFNIVIDDNINYERKITNGTIIILSKDAAGVYVRYLAGLCNYNITTDQVNHMYPAYAKYHYTTEHRFGLDWQIWDTSKNREDTTPWRIA
ncbi:MAG: hypothetical protein WCO49_19800 [Nostocales cyanobacterium ELA608]